MRAMTVSGPVSSGELGVTLPHEHLLWDGSVWRKKPIGPSQEILVNAPIDIKTLGMLRRAPWVSKDNVRQMDAELAIEELVYYKNAGGSTVVDLSNKGMGARDPLALKLISESTALHIVAGTGYYIAPSHPQEVQELGVNALADEMVREVREGIGSTDVRAGVIGELGCSWVDKKRGKGIWPSEKKVLRAAAQAHLDTGAPINIHPPIPHTGESALQALDIVMEEGVDLQRVVMSHVDHSFRHTEVQLDHIVKVAETGAHIEFDGFGMEWPFAYDDYALTIPTDYERTSAIEQLIGRGYLHQILLSHDHSTKIALRKYGGYGYDHLLTNIVPLMEQFGISGKEINTMIVRNPAKALTF